MRKCNPRKKLQKRPEKTLRLHPKLTLNQSQPITIFLKLQKTVNPGIGGKPDFHSYHVIRFRYLVFNNNNKNHKLYKETGKSDPF